MYLSGCWYVNEVDMWQDHLKSLFVKEMQEKVYKLNIVLLFLLMSSFSMFLYEYNVLFL